MKDKRVDEKRLEHEIREYELLSHRECKCTFDLDSFRIRYGRNCPLLHVKLVPPEFKCVNELIVKYGVLHPRRKQ